MSDSEHDYKYEFSLEKVQKTIEEQFTDLIDGKKPSENPNVVFMGGLPGAGKSTAIKNIAKNLGGNFVELDIDEFRQFHPHIKDIAKIARMPEMRKKGKLSYMADQTGEFAWQVKEGLKEKLKAGRYNVVIDGTLHTAEPILDATKEFKAEGYKASVVEMVATDKKTALKGTKDRFDEEVADEKAMLEAGLDPDVYPRPVEEEYLDLVAERLPGSVRELHESGEFERIRLVNREGGIHYDSIGTPELDPADVMRRCLAGEAVPAFGEDELEKSIKEQKAYERQGVKTKDRTQVSENYQKLPSEPSKDMNLPTRK